MLTLTYALVALSVEQRKVKGRVLELQQEIQLERKQRLLTNQAHIEFLVSQFIKLDEACRSRNIELYVLPAIRAATSEADSLLADIDALTLMGRITLKTVHARLRQAAARGSFELDYLCDSLQQYCKDMLKRLDLEETQVLPLAQRVISSDEWFDIAARFISSDVGRGEHNEHDLHELAQAQAAHTAHTAHHRKTETAVRRQALN
ncbi:MAG: hypothetical protein JO002_00415 [Burkholderiaceae bacterium]|nr:hypothetical protein [Burkholderiaceae bacterium]